MIARPSAATDAAGEVTGPAAPTRTRSTWRSGVARAVPWLLPVAAIVAPLRVLGVSGADIATYTAYFLGCVVLPGVLLLRALWRTTGNWAEDAALGTVFGIAFELLGWALFTALGWQRGLVVWPLLAAACFAAVPRLRRYWRIADPTPLPQAWAWGVALLATASILLSAVWQLAPHVPPPDGVAYYPDLLYHLSMVHELVRSVPPQLPQVTGEPLEYHWFPDAHLATAVDITGLPAELVLYRLWLLPIWLVGLVVFAALARAVSRVWWTGVLAVAITGFAQYVALWSLRAGRTNAPFNVLSPSQTIAVVVTAAIAIILLDLVRGRSLRATGWVAVAALSIMAGGAKPTALPLLLGGTGLAALAVWMRHRRPPLRLIAAGAVLTAAGILTTLTVAGSTAGSHPQLFAALKGLLGYKVATGDTSLRATEGWVVDSMAHGDRLAVLAAWLLLGTVLVSQLGTLVGFGLLAARSARRDPVAWWLAGAMLAGWLGYLLLAHPSGSEAYFAASTAPFAAAAVGWLAATGLRGRNRRTIGTLTVTGAVLGVVLVGAPHLVPMTDHPTRADRAALHGYPILVLLGWSIAALVGWLVARRRRPVLIGLGWPLVVTTVLGMTLPYVGYPAAQIAAAGTYPSLPIRTPAYGVSLDEQRAATWLNAHSEPTDIVVTNTACRPARRQPPGCDARGYIVTAIAGRRTLLEGWAYTQQAHRQHGQNGLPYTAQPAPWPDRAQRPARSSPVQRRSGWRTCPAPTASAGSMPMPSPDRCRTNCGTSPCCGTPSQPCTSTNLRLTPLHQRPCDDLTRPAARVTRRAHRRHRGCHKNGDL